jgi:hypothetical protein
LGRGTCAGVAVILKPGLFCLYSFIFT